MSNNVMRALPALLFLITTACAPLTPAGTGAETPSTTAIATVPRSGGILRIGQAAGDLGSLDPHYSSATQDRALVDIVFNGLLRYKPGDATAFESDLAATLPGPINNAEGKQTWTFILRHGVMCHPSDGVPAYELTSDDVVYSLQKAANKETSAYSS